MILTTMLDSLPVFTAGWLTAQVLDRVSNARARRARLEQAIKLVKADRAGEVNNGRWTVD